jgi:hypothetical protein
MPQATYRLYSPQQITRTIHSFSKHYPGLTKLYIYDTPINIRVAGYESIRPGSLLPSRLQPIDSDFSLSDFDSIRRTKTTISDIVLCNDFDLFCTFTFAADRQNVDKCKSKMSSWLKVQRQTYGRFKYIIVPEFHKDGKSIHFHALFKGYNGPLVDSGHKVHKRIAYNMDNYSHGFSTAVKIDNIDKVSSYIKKYITKDMPKFIGKKRYWVSSQLDRPLKIQNPDLSPTDIVKFTPVYKLKNLTIYLTTATIPIPNNERKPNGEPQHRFDSNRDQFSYSDFAENGKELQAFTNSTRQRVPN